MAKIDVWICYIDNVSNTLSVIRQVCGQTLVGLELGQK